MKEVKEQCEERIEEVTKRGNEAVASRDLSEKKDQSQQVILGFFLPRILEGIPPLTSGILFPCLLSDLLLSLFSSVVWFPATRQPVPGCRDSGRADWALALSLGSGLYRGFFI